MSTNKKAIEDLERLANEIGEAGAKDDIATGEILTGFQQMTKGISDAIGSVVTMLKAAPPPPAKGPPPAPPGGGDQEPDNDEDDEPGAQAGQTPPPAPARRGKPQPKQDPDAGYQDMQMGGEGEEFLDVEELIRDNVAELKRGRQDRARMLKAIEDQNALLRQVLETQIATTAPLAKGIAAVGQALVQLPGGSIVPSAKVAGGPNPFFDTKAAGRIGALDARARGVVMVKALQKGVVSDLDVARFNATGSFTPDAEANKTVVAAVEALIS